MKAQGRIQDVSGTCLGPEAFPILEEEAKIKMPFKKTPTSSPSVAPASAGDRPDQPSRRRGCSWPCDVARAGEEPPGSSPGCEGGLAPGGGLTGGIQPGPVLGIGASAVPAPCLLPTLGEARAPPAAALQS